MLIVVIWHNFFDDWAKLKKKSEIKPPLAVHTTIAWVDDIYMFKRNLARGRIACFKGLAEKRFDFPPENRSRAAVTCHTKEPTSVLLKNYSNLPTKHKFILFQQEPKGPIISECLFGVFNFFQKRNENTSHISKKEFIHSFFGRIHGLTICFWH